MQLCSWVIFLCAVWFPLRWYSCVTCLGVKKTQQKLTSDKLAPKTDKCLFVGYPKETKGYYFYNPSENKVFIARKAVFLEKEFISKKNSGSKIQLEEIQDSQIPIEDSMEIEMESTRGLCWPKES